MQIDKLLKIIQKNKGLNTQEELVKDISKEMNVDLKLSVFKTCLSLLNKWIPTLEKYIDKNKKYL